MPVRTIKVLRAARKLVANPETWTSGANARDRSGLALGSTSAGAVCWCAYGAVIRSAVSLGVHARAVDDLDDFLNRLAARRNLGSLVEANDRHGRLAALQVIDDAIAELEVRGAA